MAQNVAAGNRSGYQSYTEVLPDPVVKTMSAHHQSFELLRKYFRSSKTLENATPILLPVVQGLIQDSFIGAEGTAIKKNLQKIETMLTTRDFIEFEFVKKYIYAFEGKFEEFIKRADPEFVQLAHESIHTEKVFLGSIFKGLFAGKKSPIEAFFEFRKWIDQYAVNDYKVELFGLQTRLPVVSWMLKRVSGISSLVQDLVFGKIDTKYIEGSSVAMGNDGVTDYLKRLLIQEPELRRMSIQFYTQLEGLTPVQMKSGHPYTFWDKAEHNIWQLALDVTKKTPADAGSTLQALRILSVFGHNDFVENFDVIDSDLVGLSAEAQQKALHDFSLLNHLRPNRNSQLYAPEAIPGLNLPQKMLDDMKAYQQQLKHFYDIYPSLYRDSYMEDFLMMKMFRSGYYHFYGGSYITAEFMAKDKINFMGVNVPVTLSLAMGYYYKRITMLKTYLDAPGKFLYTEMGYQERKTMSEAELRSLWIKVNEKLVGLNKKTWTYEELLVHKLSLDINILHLEITAYQHVVGSDWAYEALKKN